MPLACAACPPTVLNWIECLRHRTYKEYFDIEKQKPPEEKTVPGPLVPYTANAMRNRLPVKFPNEAIKGARFCAPRNVSTIKCASLRLSKLEADSMQ